MKGIFAFLTDRDSGVSIKSLDERWTENVVNWACFNYTNRGIPMDRRISERTIRRLAVILPCSFLSSIFGFSANWLATSNKALIESNILAVLNVIAIGAALKAIGGKDISEALNRVNCSGEKEIIIAAIAGYLSGVVFGRSVNKALVLCWDVTKSVAYLC